MVQLMKKGKSESPTEKMAGVKLEMEDSLEEEHGPLLKRHKQKGLVVGGFELQASRYNPLDEPSPLGLRLRKSPSLLELIQMKLSQSISPKAGGHGHGKKESKVIGVSGDKLKASNFPASILKIGTWEVFNEACGCNLGHIVWGLERFICCTLDCPLYKSRYEGDLVAKCYFAKHKLVWEVLDGGLKNKIEIQWSDIMALKASYPDDSNGTLDVVLARQPLFFRETNPQPRKHTLWQSTADFTGGQASIHRRHYLECPQGLLGKHFEKLVQCDPRLHVLSQQGEITLESPYFEPRNNVFDDQTDEANEFDLNREGSPSFFSVHDAGSPSAGGHSYSSKNNDQDAFSKHSESYPRETPSPTSAMVTSTSASIEQFKSLSNWDQIQVPGMRSSISMTDLVNHLEHRVSGQGSSSNPILSSEEWQSLQILDDINRCLFTDIQHMPDSNEKTLMSRVNSLCCLLQKDGSNASTNPQSRTENDELTHMSRKDSVGELLLNLPRIASLPHFMFNSSEEYENHAR